MAHMRQRRRRLLYSRRRIFFFRLVYFSLILIGFWLAILFPLIHQLSNLTSPFLDGHIHVLTHHVDTIDENPKYFFSHHRHNYPKKMDTYTQNLQNNIHNQVQNSSQFLFSCQDLFSSQQLSGVVVHHDNDDDQNNGKCLYHTGLQWTLACELNVMIFGTTNTRKKPFLLPSQFQQQKQKQKSKYNPLPQRRFWINVSRIEGSIGGEAIQDVLGREEATEQLVFANGTLLMENLDTVKDHNNNNNNDDPRHTAQARDLHSSHSVSVSSIGDGTAFPPQLWKNADARMKMFLGSTMVAPSLSSKLTWLSSEDEDDRDDISIIVRRGNYANPCMVMLTIYNVYIVLQYYYDYFSPKTTSNVTRNADTIWTTTKSNRPELSIIWLDGHAQSDLDPIWNHLFETKPLHIKELQQIKRNDGIFPLSPSTMIVNSISVIGDEGLGYYDWGQSPTSKGRNWCTEQSTLRNFRNFVLDRFNVRHASKPTKKLTLLIRKDYRSHPRSYGFTDRIMENVTADADYLKSIYPNHSISVVSFEGMPFREQLQHIATTNILVAVHGAGNIHVLFLPPHATLVEYIPKAFRQRKRFQYLAECLNVTYISKPAFSQRRSPVMDDTVLLPSSSHFKSKQWNEGFQKSLIQVRFRPRDSL